MPFGNKSRRCGAPFIESAAGYLEKPIAGSALKMMMVLLARYLVKRSQFRRVDLLQPALLDKKLQIAIYGRLVQRTNHPAADFENFVNTQRPIRFEKYVLDGIPLVCFPLHFGSNALHYHKGHCQQS